MEQVLTQNSAQREFTKDFLEIAGYVQRISRGHVSSSPEKGGSRGSLKLWIEDVESKIDGVANSAFPNLAEPDRRYVS